MSTPDKSSKRRPFSFAVVTEFAGTAVMLGIVLLILSGVSHALLYIGKQAIGNEDRARIASLRPNAQLSRCIEGRYGTILRERGILRILPIARRAGITKAFVSIDTLAIYRSDWNGLKTTREYLGSPPLAINGIGRNSYLYAIDARGRSLIVSAEPALTQAGFMDKACTSIDVGLSGYAFAPGAVVPADVQAARDAQNAAADVATNGSQESKEARPSDR